MNVCEIIYKIGAENKVYGTEKGVCRITGNEGEGILWEKWVKPTFTDIASLFQGTIISNQALFCFEEESKLIQEKTGKEKPQRFRTYSHIIDNEGNWHCFTKANKREIYNHIVSDAKIICLAESGQKHIFFKHKLGMWQLEDIYIKKDITAFIELHKNMCDLMRLGFSQTEIIEGEYIQNRVFKAGLQVWKNLEDKIKQHRKTPLMAFTSFLLFIEQEDKDKIQESYSKIETKEEVVATKKQVKNQAKSNQTSLF